MDLQSYKIRREILQNQEKVYRIQCKNCRQPEFGCYCKHIQKFDPNIKFVILIHPIEMKRRIATGRMSHLCLENSELILGQNFSQNRKVNEILANSNYQPVILYPGIKSLNLTNISFEKRTTLFSSSKKTVVFVIDGTWATARKTMRQSENLHQIQRVGFTPPGPSRFRVRKQPQAECYSTIEAIHHFIELTGKHVDFDLAGRAHDNLLNVFDIMVERQLDFIRESFDNPRSTSYRRPKFRIAE